MRKNGPLDALFPGTRQQILVATILRPDQWWYLSDLAKHLHVRPSSLQREVARLTEAGILERESDGNRVYYRANPFSPFLPDLRGLLTKTAGLVDVLRDALEPRWASVEWAFVYGSVARTEEQPTSDIDLMLIGDVRLPDIAFALRDAERTLQRQINPTIFTRPDFVEKVHAGHHFLTTVMQNPKIFLKGSGHELEATTRQPEGESAHHESARA